MDNGCHQSMPMEKYKKRTHILITFRNQYTTVIAAPRGFEASIQSVVSDV